MLKKKIIASSVANLTDARYFAGWMVDYMHFDLQSTSNSPIAPSEIGGIQAWIEGPKYLLSVDPNLDIEKELVTYDADGVIVPFDNGSNQTDWVQFYKLTQAQVSQHLTKLKGQNLIVTHIDNMEALVKISQEFDLTIYIDTQSIDVDKEFLLSEWIEGYVVHGSPEEKVGYKSFDELDAFFEEMEDFD